VSILLLTRFTAASVSDTESVNECLQLHKFVLNPRCSVDEYDIMNHGLGTLNLLQENITISKVRTYTHLPEPNSTFMH
jgi:hypothetical protein